MFRPPIDDAARRAGFVMDLRRRGVRDRRVLSALELVPRHNFVSDDFAEFAYAERALPIACGQTIDKPSLAGRMIEGLAIEPTHRVIEIGTGSGWVTAVLALLGREVVSLDRYRGLAEAASRRLANIGITNVRVMQADALGELSGLGGFDRLIVSAAVSKVPARWLELLTEKGTMIVAVGPADGVQEIKRLEKGLSGPRETSMGHARLVPALPGLARAM
jgi:protein-L-isoaspartate(D-aspartate) O-methyltransferase